MLIDQHLFSLFSTHVEVALNVHVKDDNGTALLHTCGGNPNNYYATGYSGTLLHPCGGNPYAKFK